MKKTLRSVLLVVLCLCSLLCILACKEEPIGVWKNAIYSEDTSLGKGSKEITVQITAEDITVTLTVKTDKATLGQALYELGLADNVNNSIKKLNGITADYDTSNKYWAFYDGNGVYMTEGAYDTNIFGGENYRFVYESF